MYCILNRKISKDTIELNEMSTDMDLIGGQVKLRLQNTQLLEGISVNETHEEVIILLATVGSVHRIILRHPKMLPALTSQYAGNRPTGLSIFHDFNVESLKDSRNYYVLPNHFASGGSSSSSGFRFPTSCCSWLTKESEAVFVLGNSSGSLLVVKMDSFSPGDENSMIHSSETEGVTVFELKQSNLYDKLKGFVPSIIRNTTPEGEEAALCLIAHVTADQEDALIFVLCRDLKIRVWSFKWKRCLLTVNVGPGKRELESSIGSSPTVRRPLLRSSISDGHLHVTAFINSGDQKEFISFRVTFTSGKLEMNRVATLCPGQDEDVIDFVMYREELICLVLDSRSDFKVKSTSIQE